MTSDITRWQKEIARENRTAIHMLAYTALPMGFINMLVQMVISGRDVSAIDASWLLLYGLSLLAVDRFLIPEDTEHATAALYLLEAPVYLLAILLGSFWDPTRQASTILLFMVVLPVFVMDHPHRMALVMTAWLLVFLLCSHTVKTPELYNIDTFHSVEFFLAALVVYAVALRMRMKYLQSLAQMRYERDHDSETGCLNRNALAERARELVGKPSTLMIVDLEQQKLYRDFLGTTTAEAMLRYLAQTLTDAFGAETVYRFGGSELVCVCSGDDAQPYLERMERCRETLRSFTWEGRPISMSFALGYVTGTPETEQDAQEMLRLADIYTHKARRMGRDQTRGNAFDQEALVLGIRQSALLAETSDYENSRLTGLPDVSYFVTHADELLTNIINVDLEPVVGFINLLRLREINSRFGYAQGDLLISATAELLREALPDRYICHVTGGQFCALCYRSEADAALERVREGLKTRCPGIGVDVVCKAGFAPYTGGESAISLLDRARIAYESIRDEKGAYVRLYDEALDQELRLNDYIADHIDEAVEKGWLRVYYQPIVRSVTSEVCNEEALCRWDDPQYGMMQPARFISVLEERGITYKADLFVVRQVLRDFDRRKELGVPIVPISVNLSRRDFEEKDMVEEIAALVEASGYSKELIKIEITESAFTSNQERLKSVLRAFRARGFDIWLDDFGSEYSTLSLLQEIDFDLIKIDMKFTRDFWPNSRNYIIVSDIIDMAQRLGVATLIEGIETREQLRQMQLLGCEKVQGFYYNRPNPLDYIAERVKLHAGLTFEDPAATAYYEAVGRVNLFDPMASADGKGGMLAADIMPAGVIELRDGHSYCLRGTDSFLRRMEGWGYLSVEGDDTRIRPLIDPPEAWETIVRRTMDSGDWESFTARSGTDAQTVVYARRLGQETYRGGVAILAVLLPGREFRAPQGE